jgi:hypothetical protein
VYSTFRGRRFCSCCCKGEHGTTTIQRTLTLVQYEDVLCIVNVQHDCYSCKCNGIQHSAVRQEREKIGNTRALVDHNPEARFVVNIHSIHNYKLIAAVVPQDLLVPFTSVNGDIAALRKKAAGLVRGAKQPNDGDAAQPTDDGDPLPFDRGGKKSVAAAGKDVVFKGTLSSQSKLELMKMANVLGIPVLEKDRKQELALKVREHLDANPDARNNVQFTQLSWRPGNRKATTITPAPPETASMSFLLPRFRSYPHISLQVVKWCRAVILHHQRPHSIHTTHLC